ncbi:MAG: hypothetical protein ACKOZM_09140 [Flavobacteriales bacterium]
MTGIRKIGVICSLLVLQASTGVAQLIDNRIGNAFNEEMFFSQQFLWVNKIRSITAVVSVKRPNRPIEQRPDISVYRFNEVGLMTRLDRVTSVKNLIDSLTIKFKRNDLGSIELREETGTRGYYTTGFVYDEQGRLIRMEYGTAENISTVKNKLEPGRTIAINEESVTWNEQENGVIRKSVYNNYGLHYSNWTITKNPKGFVESEVEELIMSGRTKTKTYTYNEHGWISKIESADNMTGGKKAQTFIYDSLGNVQKVEYFDGKNMTREIEVLYTPTMLVEAFLDHNLENGDIVITKFSYEYYK